MPEKCYHHCTQVYHRYLQAVQVLYETSECIFERAVVCKQASESHIANEREGMEIPDTEIMVVQTCMKRAEHQRKQHNAQEYIPVEAVRNYFKYDRPCQIKLFFNCNRPEHRQDERIRLVGPGVHEVEVIRKEQVVNGISVFSWNRAAGLLYNGQHNKANEQAQVEQRPDA